MLLLLLLLLFCCCYLLWELAFLVEGKTKPVDSLTRETRCAHSRSKAVVEESAGLPLQPDKVGMVRGIFRAACAPQCSWLPG